MSGLPQWLQDVLPAETAESWEMIAPVVPEPAYLVGGTALAVHLRHRVSRDLDFFFHEPVDLDKVRRDLEGRGRFAVTEHTEDTLNGQFEATKVQFLSAGTQDRLEEPQEVCGIRVAGLADILATKVEVIGDRGELGDYFDLMSIENQSDLTVEDGLGFYLARYRDRPDSNTLKVIVKGLGYLGDAEDDLELPVARQEIERYWGKRQPAVVSNISREPVAARLPASTTPLDPARELRCRAYRIWS